MQHLSNTAAHESFHDSILGTGSNNFPLLQLYDDYCLPPLVILAGDKEIDTLGRQWNLVLYGHPCVFRDSCSEQCVVHVLQRILPGQYLRFGNRVSSPIS